MTLRNDTKPASEDVRYVAGQTDGRLDPRQTARRAPTVVLQYKSVGCGDAGRSGERCIWCGDKEKDRMKREHMK